jgi:hypothetical protein
LRIGGNFGASRVLQSHSEHELGCSYFRDVSWKTLRSIDQLCTKSSQARCPKVKQALYSLLRWLRCVFFSLMASSLRFLESTKKAVLARFSPPTHTSRLAACCVPGHSLFGKSGWNKILAAMSWRLTWTGACARPSRRCILNLRHLYKRFLRNGQ